MIDIALSMALYYGYDWVRYIFVVGTGITALVLCNALFEVLSDLSEISIWLVALTILSILYQVGVCILLLTNKCIKEFMYEQKNI